LQRSDRDTQYVVRNKNLEMQIKYLVDVRSILREWEWQGNGAAYRIVSEQIYHFSVVHSNYTLTNTAKSHIFVKINKIPKFRNFLQ
jgi:hypothetical protein